MVEDLLGPFCFGTIKTGKYKLAEMEGNGRNESYKQR